MILKSIARENSNSARVGKELELVKIKKVKEGDLIQDHRKGGDVARVVERLLRPHLLS